MTFEESFRRFESSAMAPNAKAAQKICAARGRGKEGPSLNS